MTIQTLKGKLDNLLNEKSLGRFFSSESVYDILNSAKNQTVTKIISAYYKTKNITFVNEHLNVLITLDPSNSVTTGSTLQEYTLPDDFLYTLYAGYCNDGTHNIQKATHLDFLTSVTRIKNRYTMPTYNGSGLCINPTYYIRNKKIGFFPQPASSGGNNYEHYYLKTTKDITLENQSNTCQFSDNLYEVIMFYALYLAATKDNRPTEAKGYFEMFEKLMTELTG